MKNDMKSDKIMGRLIGYCLPTDRQSNLINAHAKPAKQRQQQQQ